MNKWLLSFLMFTGWAVNAQFTGTINYKTEATGEPEAAKMFNQYQAREIISSWNNLGFEQTEVTGMNAGKIIYLFNESQATYCKKSDQTIIKMSVQDLAKTDEKVKTFMPQMFTYEIKALDEKSTISGYTCEKYEIVKSGFLKTGAKGYAWIASGLKISPSQLKFESEWKVILAALPVQFGFSEGAVMKLQIIEKSMFGEGDVMVTYEVTDVKKEWFPDGFLEIPDGYSK